jgi:hypothetical protein
MSGKLIYIETYIITSKHVYQKIETNYGSRPDEIVVYG